MKNKLFDGYYQEDNDCILCGEYTPYFQIPTENARANICEDCFKAYFSCGLDNFMKAVKESLNKS